MAVTSAGSAELIAVSSLISYDVYRTCECYLFLVILPFSPTPPP